jgi:ferredoxin
MGKIHFVKENISVDVNSGINIRKTAKEQGVQLYQGIHKLLNCRGGGLCGSCVIEVEEGANVSPKRRGEDKLLDKRNLNGHTRRLACQCQAYGDVKVYTLGE